MMERDYLVFYSDDALGVHPTIVRVSHPPHDVPKGSILEEMLVDGVAGTGVMVLEGAVQLPNAVWAAGMSLDLALGDGRVASVECSQGAWRVHA